MCRGALEMAIWWRLPRWAAAAVLGLAAASVLLLSPAARAEAPPKHKGAPKITGSSVDGRLLTVGEGRWKSTTKPTFSYQWEFCAPRHGPCNLIPGADGSTYRAATTQIGGKLRSIVTATTPGGSTSVTSRPSKKILAGSPLDVEPPKVEGDLKEGAKLAANPGIVGRHAADDLRIPVGTLQPPDEHLRSDPRGHRRDLHPRTGGRDRLDDRQGDGHELARHGLGELGRNPGGGSPAAGQPRTADGPREPAGRPAPERAVGLVVGHGTDHLLLPMAGVRRGRRKMLGNLESDRTRPEARLRPDRGHGEGRGDGHQRRRLDVGHELPDERDRGAAAVEWQGT